MGGGDPLSPVVAAGSILLVLGQVPQQELHVLDGRLGGRLEGRLEGRLDGLLVGPPPVGTRSRIACTAKY
jgi:hypothetical protein